MGESIIHIGCHRILIKKKKYVFLWASLERSQRDIQWQEWEKRTPSASLVKHYIFLVAAQKNWPKSVVKSVSSLLAWPKYSSNVLAILTIWVLCPTLPWVSSFHHRHQGNSRDGSFLTVLHISTLVAFVQWAKFFMCTPLNQLSFIQYFIHYSTLKNKTKQNWWITFFFPSWEWSFFQTCHYSWMHQTFLVPGE